MMNSAIVLFVSVAYGLSIALSLIVGLAGGYNGPLIALRYLSMFIPAVAVLVAWLTVGERPRLDEHPMPWRYVPIALFLIPAVMHATLLPTVASLQGGLRWYDWMTPAADGLYHTPASRGWGTVTLPGLITRILLNAIVGLAVASFLSFFEEIGWRAWLLPRLIPRLGPRLAIIVTSLIWGIWHVPFQLSGIQHIEGVSPVELAASLPLGIAIIGLTIGWLWVRTENIWIVTLAHGSLNSWSQYAFKFMPDTPAPELAELQAMRVAGIAMLMIGCLMLWVGIGRSPTRKL